MAILNSPGVFTLFATSLALAAFLRSLSADAQKSLENIMQGTAVDIWPRDAEFTKRKVNLLRATRIKLERITPWVFAYNILIGLRIFLYAIIPLSSSYLKIFCSYFDITLASISLLGVCKMFVSYLELKNAEFAIRKEMEISFNNRFPSFSAK